MILDTLPMLQDNECMGETVERQSFTAESLMLPAPWRENIIKQHVSTVGAPPACLWFMLTMTLPPELFIGQGREEFRDENL